MTTLAFIGGGNMARALISGLIARGTDPRCIHVAEPMESTRYSLAAEFGVSVHRDSHEAARDADIIVLAVKPQVMATVCRDLADQVAARNPLLISIAAGIRLQNFYSWFKPGARIVRCMPNTPALVGAGVTGLFADARVDASARSRAEAIMAAAGATVWIDDEALMDAVTAVSGSGPAYFFLLMESLIAAAERQGLTPAAARTLVLNTALGAARMAIADGSDDPAILRQRVTSPGGTTQAALERLEAGGFRDLVDVAVVRATERGRELSNQFGA
ncbi:MAG TPA: pyrroline-5-carboxylate reductase [Pseudomonadota bacterium]|jgi:pyrroline-5-carboxylate reductase|nr:pyrroline-5-carboxylate reductase [Xanthomonadales bacterium]HQW81273.1 pyrroline-5-carboxylate reductase [Pseudomonadota bacterium]